MGGSSSSTQTTNNTDNRMTDNRIATDVGGVGVNSGGGNVVITQTAEEAVKIAEMNADLTDSLVGQGFNLSASAMAEAFDFAGQSQAALSSSRKSNDQMLKSAISKMDGGNQKMMLLMTTAVGAAMVIMAFGGGK